MAKQIPKKLGKEPLIECVWEIRFSSNVQSVGSVLPGLIFSAFDKEFKDITPLSAANLPAELRKKDPNLRYVATVRLEGKPYAIQVGEHVVSLVCQQPYTGWAEFGNKIRHLIKVLQNTQLLTTPERFSLKYVDLLPSDIAGTVSSLETVIRIANRDITTTAHPVLLRAEEKHDEFINITQIASGVTAKTQTGEKISGILVDNDTIYSHADGDFWGAVDRNLNPMHDLNKKLFFELLTDVTIEKLEPEY